VGGRNLEIGRYYRVQARADRMTIRMGNNHFDITSFHNEPFAAIFLRTDFLVNIPRNTRVEVLARAVSHDQLHLVEIVTL